MKFLPFSTPFRVLMCSGLLFCSSALAQERQSTQPASTQAKPAPEQGTSAPVEGRSAEPASAKHVEIDKTTQTLRAYDGKTLILETEISTGKEGKRTPNGTYPSGTKEKMHRSKLYHNAKMPFCVQLEGNYFIHGYKNIPDEPASHGCVRLPLDGDNPAKRFYEWITPGTPINVYGRWVGDEKK